MDEESDDFGLDNTDDLEIDHHGDSGPVGRTSSRTAGSSLFSRDVDFAAGDDDLPPHGRLPAQPPRPPPPAPGNRSGSSGLFSEDNDDDLDADGGVAPPRRISPQAPRPASQAPSNQGDSSLRFSADDDDFGLNPTSEAPRRAAVQAPRPQAPAPGNRGSTSGLFSRDNDVDYDDFGGDSEDLAPRRVPGPPPRPVPPPAPKRGDSSGLFSDYGGSDLGLSATDNFGGEIDHGDVPPARQMTPPHPATNYIDPSLSLDANDSDIADLLGPQSNGGAPAPPPRPGPTRIVTVPAQPPPPASGGYGLDEEDSELRELLGESPREEPPQPLSSVGGASSRRITFQEPVAAPLPPPHPARRSRSPPQQRAPAHHNAIGRPDSSSFGYSGGSDEYGLEHDASRELGGPGAPQSRRGDSLVDDFASDEDYGEVTLGGRVPPATAPLGAGASFKRIPAPQAPGGYDPIQDPLDSPVARDGRPPPRGIPPRRRVGESSEAYVNYDDDEYGHDSEHDGLYDEGRGDRRDGGGSAFRRIPAPDPRDSPPRRPSAPSPPGDDVYEDDYDDEDEEDPFADDASWDGEIRFSSAGSGGGRRARSAPTARPGSARQPLSRGPHAPGDSRVRSTSALPPRERQAAMIEDMMHRHPRTWDIREVATWVEFIGLGQYRTKFVHNSVGGGLLLVLGEAELARDLRILPLGHRRALMAAIAQLREAAEAMDKQRAGGAGGRGRGAGDLPKGEAARVAELRRRAAEQGGGRRPSSAGPWIIPPEPFLGPAAGKTTVYEQRAKLLYQLDRAKSRAAQHAAIIKQLANNKALTDAQVAELRGKLKDLETKHKEDFSPNRVRGMTAPVASASSPGATAHHRHHRRRGAGFADAEYGPDAAVPWLPIGRGTRLADPHPERYARGGDGADDADLELTFRPRLGRIEDVPAGQVRDIVAKALKSRTPFWDRMEFEFAKIRKEREAKEEARRKRRERLGVTRRGGGGGQGEEEQQAKSKHWNNYWVPNSNRNVSSHKNFKRGSENEELRQYRSFAKDKERLSRWFEKFVDAGEGTDGDVVLERLVNRMLRALVKTNAQVNIEVGDTFDKRIRDYFKQRGYNFESLVSPSIKVRIRGAPPPAPELPDTTLYDFEQVEQYYPNDLKMAKKRGEDAGGGEGGGGAEGDDPNMVPKKTIWKRLVEMYYMERQKKLRAAIAMIKMSLFVQRHGAKWPPEQDRDGGRKPVWVPCSIAGALHQLDGRDRTFNELGRGNISRHIALKKALPPPPPVLKKEEMEKAEEQAQADAREEAAAKADAMFALMGWPHSSGDPELAPPPPRPLGPYAGGGGVGGGDGGSFGLDEEGGGAGGAVGGPDRRLLWTPPLDFWGALDEMLDRALELRQLYAEWVKSWQRAQARGYGAEELPLEPPRAEELGWRSDDPLLVMQNRAMERQRQAWLLTWERARRRRERQAARMRSQGYREEDIEHQLGPQQEAEDVDDVVRNHLFNNVELLARFKDAVLTRFKLGLAGTKKMVAVYRALRSQLFLDETRAREKRREETLRAVYDSLRPGRRRVITPAEEEAIVSRMERDFESRRERHRELVERKLAEEEASLAPWYLMPRPSSRPSSRPTSRATSPSRGASSPPRGARRSTRSQPAAERSSATSVSSQRRAASAGRTRGTSGGGGAAAGGPLENENSSRSKYAFGSSMPKTMWGPIGPVRQSRRVGASLLDSPSFQGGHTMIALERQQQQRSPGRGGGGGKGGGGTATPTQQRPATPTCSSGGGGGTPGSTGRSPTPPQRPRFAPAPPASMSRPSGGGTATPGSAGRRPSSAVPPSSVRSSGGGAVGGSRPASAAVSSLPWSRAPQSASPGRGGRRIPAAAAPPASPRRSTPNVQFVTPPSPMRSSGGGSLAASGRGGGHPRRGLMDGDTTSGTSSPERGPPRRGAGRAGAVPGSATAATAALFNRRGLADSDSSPSPQPRSRPSAQAAPLPPPPPAAPVAPAFAARALAPAAPAAPAPAVPAAAFGNGKAATAEGTSRRSSTASGIGPPSAGQAVPRTAAGSGAAATTAAARISAAGSAPQGRDSGSGSIAAGPRASATVAAAGGSGDGGGGSAPGSRRLSTPPGAALMEQDSSTTSRNFSTSATGGGDGIRVGSAGASSAGRGSTAGGSAPQQKSPLSRSPQATSPRSLSPALQSPTGATSPPPSQSPPQARSPSPRSSQADLPPRGSVAPSPQPSQAETTGGSSGVWQEARGGVDVLDEYQLDADEGADLDYGDDDGTEPAKSGEEDF